jgi:hypothetical protein
VKDDGMLPISTIKGFGLKQLVTHQRQDIQLNDT